MRVLLRAPGAGTARSGRAAAGSSTCFVLVFFALFLSSTQAAMVSVAFPDLMADLDAPLRLAQWTLSIYALSWAVSAPISGKLVGQLGRWPVFNVALAGFAIASIACWLAPNIGVLILGRAVQGFCSGAIQPAAYAILSAAFPTRRARVLGLVAAIYPIGSVIGPSLGGLIADTIGWRWTFGVAVPLIAVLTVVAVVVARRERAEPAPGFAGMDFTGAGMLAGAMVGFIFGLTELGRVGGDRDPLVIVAAMLVAVILAAAFVRHELTAAEPLIDLRVLRRAEFASVCAGAFLWNLVFNGYTIFLPLYAKTVYQFSASKSGLLLTPRAIVTVSCSVVASMLFPLMGYRLPMAAGLAVMGFGIGLTALGWGGGTVLGVHVTPLIWLGLLVCLVGAGSGFANPALSSAGLDRYPEQVAALAGVRSMFMLLGSAVGSPFVAVSVSAASGAASGFDRAYAALVVVALLGAACAIWIPARPSS